MLAARIPGGIRPSPKSYSHSTLWSDRLMQFEQKLRSFGIVISSAYSDNIYFHVLHPAHGARPVDGIGLADGAERHFPFNLLLPPHLCDLPPFRRRRCVHSCRANGNFGQNDRTALRPCEHCETCESSPHGHDRLGIGPRVWRRQRSCGKGSEGCGDTRSFRSLSNAKNRETVADLTVPPRFVGVMGTPHFKR
jgi:hypothetical protein